MTPLTLMAVHAHPDDEASSTGGILARYSAEGVRTVLVTCTNGEYGDAPGGAKPGEPGHVEHEVVEVRRRELERSCQVLGVSNLELLGYRDSGMMGWPSNDSSDSFWQVSVESAADRLGRLFERYRPQVVVTYDSFGFYGHPDHIQAHRITVVAFDRSDIPSKLYCPTVPRSRLSDFRKALAEAGVDVEIPDPEADTAQADTDEAGAAEADGPLQGGFGSPDEEIAAWVDCRSVADKKFAALAAHVSQAENVFFLKLPMKTFSEFFGQEAYVALRDRVGTPRPQDDLFAGLR